MQCEKYRLTEEIPVAGSKDTKNIPENESGCLAFLPVKLRKIFR